MEEVYSCIKTEDEFIFSTNLVRISEFSGIPYHRLYKALSNGTSSTEIDGYKLYKGELVKGRQRVSKEKLNKIDKFFNE